MSDADHPGGSAETTRPRMAWYLERWGLGAVCAATVAAALLTARNRWAPYQGPLTLGLVFWAWFALFYLSVALPAGFVSGWLAARRGIRTRVALVLTATAFLVAAALNVPAWKALGELEGAARYRWLLPLSLAAAVVGLCWSGYVPVGRRVGLRVLSSLAVAAGLVALCPPQAAVRGESARFLPEVRPSGERLLLIGLDGADWRLIDALSGQLPNLERLRAEGAWGSLETQKPTLSPRIWTTIATGKNPEEHRILDFTTLRTLGVHAPILRRHTFERSLSGLGFGLLHRLLLRQRILFESPVTSVSRRVPAYWNIATAQQSPVSVLNWWATWPAEPVLGAIVSERIYYERSAERGVPREAGHYTYPAALESEIRKLALHPDQVRYEDARRFMDVTREQFESARTRSFQRRDVATEFPHFYSMFETNRRLSLHLIERGRAEYGDSHDLLVLFRILDQACHTALRMSDLAEEHLRATPENLRRYGGVVSEAYREADRAIGEIMSAYGPGNVVIISDHGFGLEHMGIEETPVYDHRWAPPGIFLGVGPAFRPGRIDGLSVLDVMPALLYLKGFAVADDMPGRIPDDLFAESFRENHPLQRIASYHPGAGGVGADGSTEVDEQMLERLRALGYIN